MNPQQPGGAMPPPNPNQPYAPQLPPSGQPPHAQYDFIMNPQQPVKAPGAGSGSTITRVAIFGVGLVVLLVAILVGKSLLSSSGPNDTSALISVAQDQAELLRVSGLATTNISDQSTLNLVITAKYSLTTSNQKLLAYMGGNGVKVDAKVIGLKHSALTDSNLSSAAANSTYDSELVSIIQADLTTYSRDLKSAYALTTGPKGRALLQSDYSGAQLLLTQSKQQ
jgi:hypothetical protein